MKIEAKELTVLAGRTSILDDIQLSLNPGEFIGILGPSGSGKSTLLTALSGRRKYNKGEVLYDGEPLEGRPGETIGFVPQDDNLHTALKTGRLLSYSARLQMPGKTKQQISKLIDLTLRSVGLEDRKKTVVKKLSGGQRKRVSIAQELLLSPKALFLDEPTSGLDPELEKSVMKLCARLAKEGRLVVMTTHILDSISLFDRLMFLVAGKTAFFGTPDEAMAFFKVEDFHHIYPLLARPEASRYAEKYKTSLIYRKYFKGG
ncbi:MAG TPA: ABC transporter ATP-binding protein [Phycisphaerales bacterium]|nr:ABC transporter ATP-binding protein [Phycisphaerales bacterium]